MSGLEPLATLKGIHLVLNGSLWVGAALLNQGQAFYLRLHQTT